MLKVVNGCSVRGCIQPLPAFSLRYGSAKLVRCDNDWQWGSRSTSLNDSMNERNQCIAWQFACQFVMYYSP